MLHYALDEMFAEEAAPPLDLVARMAGGRVSHVLEFAPAGTGDADLPSLCRTNGVDVFVSVNVRDFGAKLAIYQALMDEGVHIAVLRHGKRRRLVPEVQVALLSQHMPHMHKKFGSVPIGAPRLLIRLTESAAVTRSLDELVAEFDAPRLP